MMKRIGELKAEVQHLKFILEEERQIAREDGAGLRHENARLKAEVEEIRKLIDKRMVPLPGRTTLEEVERICSAHLLMGITIDKIGNLNIFLEDKVERLTKAGDGLHAFLINYIVESRISSAYLNKLDDGWLNAKKGGQS
jgi:nitrogenase molybdenum-iron protein alpha/beta subunit